ncbi:sensor histidine kinase [Leptolyngbya sp. NIES-2104]|uniref:sensor histidine kinase n=1 Tax=Leptolyngbya sp. NIES-2104 TaxID=1552121 RepID=UPI00092EF86D|nr:ATP-binding protein [Leptolyngbya sp. NIES-2104]
MKLLHKLPKLSLSYVLVVPFVTQIFIAVGLTGYWSLRHGQQSIEQLVNQLSSESSKRVEQHLDSYLVRPHKVNYVNARSLEKGLLSRDLRTLGHYFWEQMRVYQDFAFINYADQDGNFIGINRDARNVLQMDIIEPPHLGTYYRYDIDQGKPTKPVTKVPYEPRQEVWYTDAITARKPLWTRIYFWNDDKVMAISSSHPVFNDRQQIIGVVGVDYLLDRINDFLKQLRPSPSASVFILERDGLLVGNSSDERTYTVENNQPKRIKGSESSDRLIRETTQYIIKKYGSLDRIREPKWIKTSIRNHSTFVQVNPWRDQYGLDWLVVIAMPESDFTEQIHRNTQTTILLCAIALIITTSLGLLTARWIARSIDRLNIASSAIAQGDLHQTVQLSQIGELATLAQSFNSMVTQLRASFIALEQTNADLESRVNERTEKLSNALQSLQTAQAQMLQSEKMSSLGQMVAGIAHEINNPVTFISGNLMHADKYANDLMILLALYQKHLPDTIGEIRDYLEECDFEFVSRDLPRLLKSMQEGANRIQSIVLSLRNFSRLDEAQLKTVDLQEGLENTLLLLQHRLKHTSKRQEIKIIKAFQNLPKIECYAGQLNQVFLNLLGNAIDALENINDRPLIIWISTEATDSSAIVRIRDNGQGIPNTTQPKIFDPFFTTKPVGQGTGLGLSIAYQIVVGQHHGALSCTSEMGKGTEFTIDIPIHPV